MNKVGMIVIGIVIGMLCITAYQNWFCPGCRMDLLANKPVEAPVIAAKPKPENKPVITEEKNQKTAERKSPKSKPDPRNNPAAMEENAKAKPKKTREQKSSHQVLINKLNSNDYLILRDFNKGRRTWMTRNELSGRWKFKKMHFPKFNPYEKPSDKSGPMIWTEIHERGTTKLEWVLHIISAKHNCASNSSNKKSCRKDPELWFGDSGTILKTGNNAYWKTYKDQTTGRMHSKIEIPINSMKIGIMETALESENFYINYGEGDLKVINRQDMRQTLHEFKRMQPNLKIKKFRKPAVPSTENGILSYLQLTNHDRMQGISHYINEREITASEEFSELTSEFVKYVQMKPYPKIHLIIHRYKNPDSDIGDEEFMLILSIRSNIKPCGGTCDGKKIHLYNSKWGIGKKLFDNPRWKPVIWKQDYDYETIQLRLDWRIGIEMLRETVMDREAIIDYGEGEMELTEDLKREMLRTIQIYDDLIESTSRRIPLQ